MIHSSTISGFLILAMAGAAGTVFGDIDYSVDKDTVTIVQNGTPLSNNSVRFVVQEWKRAAGAGQSSDTVEQQGVGSTLVQEFNDELLLLPANEAWNETPLVRLEDRRGKLLYTADYPGSLRIEATFSKTDKGMSIAGELRNLSDAPERQEVPLTLSLVLPIDEQPLSWLADLHESRDATLTEEHIEAVATTAGARGAMSRYPFGAVSGDQTALAVGLPLDQPRIHRIRWDGTHSALIAEIDVTMSDVPVKLKNSIPFEFHLFDFDPEFGYRGAARAYYDLFPGSFETRSATPGQWMPFTQIDQVQRPEDFLFAYHEYHPNVSVAYNEPNSIESLVYCEPPVQYINLSPDTPRDRNLLLGIIANLSGVQGSQVRTSITHNAEGEIMASFVETPWAVGARVPTNGDPDLPRTAENPYNSFDANWKPYIDLYRRNALDDAAGWMGSGKVADGVIGADGRALYLQSGATASQFLDSSGGLKIKGMVKGRRDAKLELTFGEETHTVEAGQTFQPLSWAPKATASEDLILAAVNGDIWIDNLEITGAELQNGDFESGELDSERVTGLYLDSFEGWDSKDLNFRREHFPYTDIPLTFDTRTGQTAQVIMMHNFELAAEARRRLHDRGHLLMANTALYQWCWSTHYLDVLGIETSWGETATISPPKLPEMDYLRTMLYQKPYCYLQNVRYENFRGQKIEDYFARCFHFGLWPGFFSHNAAEAPYWQDPELYNADRPVFLRYMVPQRQLAVAGWEPITLASISDSALLVERWGGGPFENGSIRSDDFYFSVYNPTDRDRSATLHLDPRIATADRYLVIDPIAGKRIAFSGEERAINVYLRPMGVGAARFLAYEADTIGTALSEQRDIIVDLLEKYRRHGFLSGADATNYSKEFQGGLKPAGLTMIDSNVSASIEEIYAEEWSRAIALYRVLAAAREECESGTIFEPAIPGVVVPGEEYALSDTGSDDDYRISYRIDEGKNQEIEGNELKIPESARPGGYIALTVQSGKDDSFAPYYEARIPVTDAVSLIGLPDRIVMGDEESLVAMIRNNLQRKTTGMLRLDTEGLLSAVDGRQIPLAPGEELEVSFSLKSKERPSVVDADGQLRLNWESGDSRNVEDSVPLTILSRNASLLRTSDVTVNVDSYYFGYDKDPLTDGVIDTAGLDWKQAAWASEEGAVPHWVEFAFKTPRSLREVVIYWAEDSGSYWTSQELRIEVKGPGDGEWTQVGLHQDPAPVRETRIEFTPATVKTLRLYQPVGAGPEKRSGILWLSEVEAR